MTLLGATARFVPWSADELSTLREAYARGGIYAAAEALPHRSIAALYHRADRLGIKRRRRWTRDDDRRLRELWAAELSLREIAGRLGRTEQTTYHRAQQLGLPLGVPAGWEYLTRAAERTGYMTTQLRRILAAADVPVRRALVRPSQKRRGSARNRRLTWIVWPPDVDVAVARWLETEPLNTAARRLGVCGETLARWLRLIGVEKPAGLGKRAWRVHEDEVRAAVEHARRTVRTGRPRKRAA